MGAISKGDSMEWLKNRLDPGLVAISFQFSFLVLGTLFVIVLLFASCSSITTEARTTESGLTYEYFTIDGMPCVYVNKGAGLSWGTGGPSCDWSKWEGER